MNRHAPPPRCAAPPPCRSRVFGPPGGRLKDCLVDIACARPVRRLRASYTSNSTLNAHWGPDAHWFSKGMELSHGMVGLRPHLRRARNPSKFKQRGTSLTTGPLQCPRRPLSSLAASRARSVREPSAGRLQCVALATGSTPTPQFSPPRLPRRRLVILLAYTRACGSSSGRL